MGARLKTGLWVRAVIRRISSDGTSAMVLKKGDEDAGAVLIVLRDREDNIAILRENGSDWVRADVQKAGLDEYLERQRRYDPDLWLIELEVRNVETPLERTLGSRRADLDVMH
ncbi:hypothetical protein Gbth_015_077 [Gluconobacter thailandicus F149-1 = NBRC 100600]|uniref:DUF1491 family protein n=2 Tax=Gluconobacter thailandicus TaxID=257438 RepID=A0AAJ0QMZ3_GLUTH|nr:DUF1491 family protein [Gluconobacter thailandicus]AFW00458.1 hypothetical protein B932_0863 [Gluconobacter oxydans H24]ANQ40804.1 hypothetical protein BAR24_04640 [Gluconobacter oxydans]GAN89480.1 hypothetical protein Gbfr_006_048 [Gluconobacter frateurii M-2]KXV33751.1 hypothetical protein AD940_09920 [Gluconobacter thailandicus]KXV52654.1 hypothetical protein AD946_11565 [Gluconobacter thailandicus]